MHSGTKVVIWRACFARAGEALALLLIGLCVLLFPPKAAASSSNIVSLETPIALPLLQRPNTPYMRVAKKEKGKKVKSSKSSSRKKSTGNKKGYAGSGGGRGFGAIRKFDKNGDGWLSRSEWPKSAKSFNFIDANKDGRLSVSEISTSKARRAKMRALTAAVSVWAADDDLSFTIKEANAITSASEGTPVAALPPTIDDITAILDQQKLADPALAEKQREIAAAKPPAGKSKQQLALFYRERGKAAGKIGKREQEISDLRKALALAKSGRIRKLPNIMGDLANALQSRGAIAESMELRKQAIATARSMRKTNGLKIKMMANLISLYVKTGNIRQARVLMGQIEKRLGKSKLRAPKAKWRYEWFPRALNAKADLLQAQGRLDKAEDLLRAGVKLVDQAKNRKITAEYGAAYRDNIRRALAKNLFRQGRLVEAEISARDALIDVLSRVGKFSNETPPNLMLFATILLEQGRTEEASKLAETAIGIMKQTGVSDDSAVVIKARRLQAQAKILTGDFEGGLSIYDAITEVVKKDRWLYQNQMLKDREWMLALIFSGRHKEAATLLTESLARQRKNSGKQNGALQGMLAMALAKDGEGTRALKLFEKSVPKLVKSAESQEDEEYTLRTSRQFRVNAILEGYLGLLADLADATDDAKTKHNHIARSFIIAELARGQSVQRAVSAAAARANVDDEDLAKLVRDEQDTRKRITAQSALLVKTLSKPTDQQDPESIEGLRASVTNLRAAADSLTKEIEKKFPNYSKLLNPQAPGIAEIQNALQSDEAFVSIYLGRERSYVWALPKQGALVFHASKLTRDKASKFVEALRGALNPQVATLGDIPDFDVRVAYKLYQQILQPVEAGWKSANSLLVSTNGALGQLPLTVLPTQMSKLDDGDGPLFANYRDIKWLARSHAMTLLPSAATLVTLRSIPKGDETRKPFIGFGDPVFNAAQAKKKDAAPVKVADALASRGLLRTRGLPIRLRAAPKMEGVEKPDLSLLPPLPDTGEEVRGIAIAMNADPSVAVQLGIKVNEDTIRNQDLSGYKVIAFATHGLIPGDLSGLREPALALSSPDVAKSGGDGLLTMSEIMGLKLDADWVVLSACNTGSGRGAGAEAISGLGRAFFYAGTRALLVSSWPVETISARLLTTDVFTRMTQDKGLSRAAALQQAISALIDKPAQLDPDTREPLFYYAHPIFWAPFILVGDGGASAS
jgi:CHAT domain-containing protein